MNVINTLYFFLLNKHIILNNIAKFNYILQLVNTVINAIEGKVNKVINAIEEKYSVKFNYVLHCNIFF